MVHSSPNLPFHSFKYTNKYVNNKGRAPCVGGPLL